MPRRVEMKSSSNNTSKPGKSKPPRPRGRTFTGCRTCRSRHLKCDEKKPSCSTCLRLNIPCPGYAPDLRWITEDSPLEDQTGSSCRHLLYGEKERACMSLDLVQSLEDADAGRAVTDLDNDSVDKEETRCIGPFGVFHAFKYADPPQTPPSSSPEEIPLSGTSSAPQAVENDGVAGLDEVVVNPYYLQEQLHLDSFGGSIPMPEPEEVIPESHEDDPGQLPYVPWAMDVPSDLGQLPETDLAGEIEDWMQLGSYVGNGSPMSLSLDAFGINFILSPRSGTPTGRELEPRRPSLPRPDKSPTIEAMTGIPRGVSRTSDNLTTHTPLLLRHLKENVLAGSPRALQRLSPWKVLFLPRALETFAEMSIFNETSFTRRSILSALLSKSAYHLHMTEKNSSTTTHWLQVASTHQQEAAEHLKSALSTELWGEKQAEYTEMLMAMLSVGFAKLNFDGPRALKKLLLDAERLIRLRGLPSDKPHTLRMLHHMYTHVRVIAESTSIQPLLQSSNETSLSAPLQLGFTLDENNLGDLDATREKAIDVGYNDIHLEVSGRWQVTMYPEMYGLPESLMTLMSQTISLANEKPRLEVAALHNPAISIALPQHTRTLEQQIWAWTPSPTELPTGPPRPPELITADTPALDRPDARLMVLATHQAIIILFYRRVYNMSAMILQEQVRKTLDYLAPLVGVGVYDQDFAMTIGWSCFIAACEAVTPELQEKGLEFLDAMSGTGAFVETDQPSVLAKSVWEQRSRSGDMTYSWPDLLLT